MPTISARISSREVVSVSRATSSAACSLASQSVKSLPGQHGVVVEIATARCGFGRQRQPARQTDQEPQQTLWRLWAPWPVQALCGVTAPQRLGQAL